MNKKRKILFILHMPPPIHGASLMGQYIYESELINKTFNCRYLNLAIASSIDDIQKFRINKLLHYLCLLIRIITQVLYFRPHLVYFTPNACGKPFYKEFPIMVLLKLMGRNVVAHYHNQGVLTRNDKWFDNMLYRFFFYHTKVILLSERLYFDVAKYVRREDVQICPNGIPITEMLQFEREDKTSGTPVLLFLSNLLIAKGVWTLVDSLTELNKKKIDFKCIIAGSESAEISGKQLQFILNEKGLSDKVSYFGPAYGKNKFDLFKQSDIFVFPTHNECFGLVLLEAMQCALPCVTTSVGGIPDVVKNDVNGIIVNIKNPKSLTDSLEKLINDKDLRIQMGFSGRSIFKQCFTIEMFYMRLTNILELIS